MKILLIQPPHYYDGKCRGPSNFPLGLGYIAKVLLNSGYKVEVLDIWAHQYTDEEVRRKIPELDYDVCGISALSTQYAYVKRLTSELKKHSDALIVVGNALATFSPEIVLNNTKADICCIGEGEITFKEIVENNSNLERVNGIYFKQNNEIIKNPSREYINDLDTIDFPAWDLFPMHVYLKYCRVYGGTIIRTIIPAMNVITARGCPYNCRFCSKTFRGIRFRSADNIIEEIKLLQDKYGVGAITFNDELVVINKKRGHELCEKIEPLNIKWDCQGRANLVDIELLKRMKKAGCVAVGYGIESGSQTILNNMNKQITIEQAERAIKDTLKVGMYPIIQMMYGYPGETRETLQETVDFFRKFPYLGYIVISTAVNFSPTTPLPGSELYDQTLKDGLIKNEEGYLYSLEAGYMPDGARILVNFTEFNNEEFYQLMQRAEREIFLNHVRGHLFQFMMDYPLMHFSTLLPYIREHGYKQTIKRIIEKAIASMAQLRK